MSAIPVPRPRGPPSERMPSRVASPSAAAARYRHRPGPPRRPGLSSPTFATLGPPSRPALPHPPRPQSGRLPARSGPRSLPLAPCTPCIRVLTASPRPRQITGDQRARLTPNTLAFAPLNAPLQARRRGSRGRPDGLDAGRPRAAGVNRSDAPPRASATAILLHLARPCGNSTDLRRRPTPFPRKSTRTGNRAIPSPGRTRWHRTMVS
jgi:hypothetical protein